MDQPHDISQVTDRVRQGLTGQDLSGRSAPSQDEDKENRQSCQEPGQHHGACSPLGVWHQPQVHGKRRDGQENRHAWQDPGKKQETGASSPLGDLQQPQAVVPHGFVHGNVRVIAGPVERSFPGVRQPEVILDRLVAAVPHASSSAEPAIAAGQRHFSQGSVCLTTPILAVPPTPVPLGGLTWEPAAQMPVVPEVAPQPLVASAKFNPALWRKPACKGQLAPPSPSLSLPATATNIGQPYEYSDRRAYELQGQAGLQSSHTAVIARRIADLEQKLHDEKMAHKNSMVLERHMQTEADNMRKQADKGIPGYAFEPLLTPAAGLAYIAQRIRQGRAKKIVFVCGAGVSVAAGIEDYRSDSGVFSNMGYYGLKEPKHMFTLRIFERRPETFHDYASTKLLRRRYRPTKAHYFFYLAYLCGCLLRCFTMNVDSLERLAGLPEHKLVESHGNCRTASCIRCKRAHSRDWLMAKLDRHELCYCVECGGLVKPDIVFYGEALPQRHYKLADSDIKKCDLIIAMGSSLVVDPFCEMLDKVPDEVPRLLINKNMASVHTAAVDRGFRFGAGLYSPRGTREN